MSNRFINTDYYQHIINKPNIVNLSTDFSNILVINSDDRDRHLYPNSNEFIIELNNTYSDVIEIEIISIDYDYSRNTFDQSNNEIHISIDDISYKHSIPTGEYKNIDNVLTTFNNLTQNSKELGNRKTDISLGLYQNIDKTYFIFNNSETVPLCKVLYSGEQIIKNRIKRTEPDPNPFNRTMFNNINDVETNIYNYKQQTDGSIIGFSEKNFSNSINPSNILQAGEYNNYTITLQFSDNQEYDKLYNLINMPNIELEINGKNIGNILGFKKDDNSIDIKNTVSLDPITSSYDIRSNIILSDISYNLKRDHTIYLDIKGLDRLASNNKFIDNTFAAIPVNMSTKIYFDNTKAYGTIKYFNPPKRYIDKLEICFKDKNGRTIEYMGKEHSIVLAIKCLNDKNNLGF